MDNNKPVKTQWYDYLVIQKSGFTNMCNISAVGEYSAYGLTKNIIFYIMDHYNELEKEYGITLDDITKDDLRQYGLALLD